MSSRLRTGVLRLLRLQDSTRSERAAVAWTAAAFFGVMAAYYLMRPLREAVGTSFGGDRLLGLFTLTFVLITVLNQPYMLVVNRWPVRRFLPAALHLFAASFVLFAAMLAGLPAGDPDQFDWLAPEWAIPGLFYSWVTAFSVCGNALVWVHAVDQFTPAQGRRLFGLIAIGGTAGQILGSGIASLGQALSRRDSLLAAAVALELALLCWFRSRVACERMRAQLGEAAAGPSQPAPAPRVASAGVFHGIVLLFRSGYLAGMAAFVLLQSIAATTFYYLGQGLAQQVPVAERGGYFAAINLWSGVAMLLLQLFATGRVLLSLGLAVTLCIMAGYSLFGFSALAIVPAAGLFAVVEVGRRTLQFAFDKPAREVLYTPLDLEAKYKSKAFIDTTVMRFGDLLGALVNHLHRASAPLALAGPLLLGWLGLGLWLGRQCVRRERAAERSAAG